MTIDNLHIELSSEQIKKREFIELLKQLVQATNAMRCNVEEIDLLLEEAHRIPLAA